MTLAPTNEIAIGRKINDLVTFSLRARIRSESSARTRPNAVAKVGARTIQSTVLMSTTRIVGLVNAQV